MSLLEKARMLEKKAFDPDYGVAALTGGAIGVASASGLAAPALLAAIAKKDPKALVSALRVAGSTVLKGYGAGSVAGLGMQAMQKPTYY
jgi:hypothetical protein